VEQQQLKVVIWATNMEGRTNAVTTEGSGATNMECRTDNESSRLTPTKGGPTNMSHGKILNPGSYEEDS
jgi:hypothetical protein